MEIPAVRTAHRDDPPLEAKTQRRGLGQRPVMKGRKITSCMLLFTRHLSHFNVSIKAQIALQQQHGPRL